MGWPTLTFYVILIVTISVILYDILAAVFGGEGSTISEVTLGIAKRRPIIVLALGILLGHLFWPQ